MDHQLLNTTSGTRGMGGTTCGVPENYVQMQGRQTINNEIKT